MLTGRVMRRAPFLALTSLTLLAACDDAQDDSSDTTTTSTTSSSSMSSSTTSSSSSSSSAGGGASCGDSVVDAGEACDDGNTTTESCDYGLGMCDVCDDQCQLVAGATSLCGDGAVDAAHEDCDDTNVATETCTYGVASCKVCDDTCHEVDGATSTCGDGTTDPLHEDCDDGNATTEACTYGELACSACDATCHTGAGVPSFCGDGAVDGAAGEDCDDMNTVTEVCAYGLASCTVCDATCDQIAGATSTCGDGVVQAGTEDCDDSNAVTEPCAYGAASCTVCDGSCHAGPGTVTVCGDGVVDAANGEDCDDGNTTLEACAYGLASCSVCDATCKSVAGTVSFCGDAVIDAANGEDCEDGNTVAADGCEGNCTFVCGQGSGGTKAFQTTAGCFVRFDAAVTLSTAISQCSAIGMSLPEVHGATTNAQLVSTLSGQNIWFGLGDAAVEGTYVWQSGAAADYLNWNAGEPNNSNNEDCTEFYSSGKWNDAGCTGAHPVVCMSTTCGNGALDAGEACDDGNHATESCPYGVTSCGSVCGDACNAATGATSYCGDSRTDATNGEGCDDANAVAGDGCDACNVSPGYACVAAPSVCFAGSVYTSGPGLALTVPDNGYNGTLASMRCVSIPVASVGDGVVDSVALKLGVTATWLGDLVVKVLSPAGTTVTVMSQSGNIEPADDGVGSGDSSDLSAAAPILFIDSSTNDAETMGSALDAGQTVCATNNVCVFKPNRGAATGGTLSAFVGEAEAGTWQVCVGDTATGDIPVLDLVQLVITQ